MKKITRLLASILAVSMLSTVMVGAAEANPQGAYVLPGYDGAPLVFQDADKNPITETYSLSVTGYDEKATVYVAPARVSITLDADDGVMAGQQYVVFLLGGSDVGNTIPGEKNIRYIDQLKSDSTTVSFNLYPDTLTSAGVYNIYVTSNDGVFSISEGTEPVASFTMTKPPYPVGDVDQSGAMDVGDATRLLRYLADLTTASDVVNLDVADVDGSGGVDVGDVTKMLRVLADLDTL